MVKKISILLVLLTACLLSADNTISFTFTGDMMMGTDFPKPHYLPPKKGAFLFARVQRYLTNTDILMGNLEGVICRRDTRTTKRPGKLSYSFRMPPHNAALLKKAGFDIINLANNHANDFGRTGLRQCTNYLGLQGIAVTGLKDMTCVVTNKGLKIMAIGFSTSPLYNHILDIPNAVRLVKKYRPQCDILIVTFHGGAEGSKFERLPKKPEYYYKWPRGDVYKFSRSVIDHGADLVIGHGPHVLRAMEIYKGKLIAYSLGNFMGYARFSTAGKKGYSVILETTVDRTGDFVHGRVIPITLTNRGVPQFDSSKKGNKSLNRLNKLDFPDKAIVIGPDGRFGNPSKGHRGPQSGTEGHREEKNKKK